MSIYKIINLSFKWPNSSAALFSSLNFEIKKSSFTGIIGKNGTGKTTLIKILVNLLLPTTGKVYLEEENIKKMSRKNIAKKVAYVSQNTDENVQIKVKDIVNLGNFANRTFFIKNDKDLEKNVNESLEITGITHLSGRIFASLSGGEKQKVMIARALCQNTEIILLDEPTSSLDIKNKIEIMNLLSILSSKKSLTIVAVSHDLNLISNYADMILLMQSDKFYYGTNQEMLTSSKLKKTFETDIKILRNENERIIYY